MTDKFISIEGIAKRYPGADGGEIAVFENLWLSMARGEFGCVIGHSGCGKTTVLNILAGLDEPSEGTVIVDGQAIEGTSLDRAVIFQSHALLPWRTVLGNVRYGLECLRVPRREARERAAHFVALVGLSGFEHNYPYELSGGMQQRVNLARALVMDPKILLMDEPFAALDAQTREAMQEELLRIWKAAGKTVLFVTHQIDEAIFLSDRVIEFSARPGRVRKSIAVDIERPRALRLKREARFHALEDRIWTLIHDEAGASPDPA
jgi:nitrate/nitrite transport system ATP-binding protein